MVEVSNSDTEEHLLIVIFGHLSDYSEYSMPDVDTVVVSPAYLD